MTEILSIDEAPRGRSDMLADNLGLVRRYRAERRFRLYGIWAILLTAAFLGVLLADILHKGLPAFTQNTLLLDVPIPAELVAPGQPITLDSLRAIDFAKLVREAARSRFSDVTDRKRRKALDGLLSSGAGDELRRRILADPSLIGTKVSLQAMLSDEADLHLKGGSGTIDRVTATGLANVRTDGPRTTIDSASPDFASALALVEAILSERIRLQSKEVARLEALLLAAANTVDQQSLKQKLGALSTQLQSTRDNLASAASSGLILDESVPSVLVSVGGGVVKADRITTSSASGATLVPVDLVRPAKPGDWRVAIVETPERDRTTSDQEIAWLDQLMTDGHVSPSFNWLFFTSGDSREPELAGIRGALIGSVLTLCVTLLLCLPIGVAAAIYLEEFAPKNRLTDVIEVNINNLAAVPSIVFGLLGLAVFLNFFGLPRSAPLVGGLVLALLVLPTIIIASRAALKAVPPSIKEAALGIGASHQQAIFHHVLPLALPGIMTGTIIGMAHALGETAPLLMIGMVAFIVEIPSGFTSAATALPVQIYLWSDLPEVAFQSKTAAAIIVLLAVLFVMNGLAIYLRRRFERRW